MGLTWDRAAAMDRQPRPGGQRCGWDSLTPAEIVVAALVEEGLSNPEIAARLVRSRRTVTTHVSHILGKLGVRSRASIARESALHRAGRPA